MTAQLPAWVQHRQFYDDVEIHPVAVRKDLLGDPYYETCPPSAADQWTLYLRCDDGDLQYIADYTTAHDAYIVADFISTQLFKTSALI